MSSSNRLDSESAVALWEGAAEAIDPASLSALTFERRDAQPMIPVAVGLLALKALVGVFCGGVFIGLGAQDLGKRAGEGARGLLRKLRDGKVSEVDADQVSAEVEGWVAELREKTASAEAVADAERAVANLLVERGEDPEYARACAHELAGVILGRA